ncbi:MAG: O-acetyl-ADP-ribose deacetylase [Flaviflexus sp.]|nr:O-acetyl-ADP-ribose deacetylase [Flaviflexus sp.]
MNIELAHVDITTLNVDAIVNAANSSLLGGGGVDGAIHRAAGPELLAACQELRADLPDGLPVGEAVATAGFNLPARYVIHTVGPNRHAGQTDPAMLSSCFTASLALAEDLGLTTIAFPAISAGVYGWDAADVARIGLTALAAHDGNLDTATVALFSGSALDVWTEQARRLGITTN